MILNIYIALVMCQPLFKGLNIDEYFQEHYEMELRCFSGVGGMGLVSREEPGLSPG